MKQEWIFLNDAWDLRPHDLLPSWQTQCGKGGLFEMAQHVDKAVTCAALAVALPTNLDMVEANTPTPMVASVLIVRALWSENESNGTLFWCEY